MIPVIDISSLVATEMINQSHSSLIKTVLIARYENKKFALIVDELLSQQRIVQKQIGKELKNVPGVSGGTILGDGKVALILESGSLIEHYCRLVS